jgi:hypothetical protein
MPASTSVLRRIGEQLVAPRASRGELLVVYTAAVAGSALAVVLAAGSGLSLLSSAVVAAVAIDLFGGSVQVEGRHRRPTAGR